MESSPDSTLLYTLFFPIWTRSHSATNPSLHSLDAVLLATPITAFDVSLLPQRALRIPMENSVFVWWSRFDVVSCSSSSRRPSPRRLAVRSSFTQLARGEAWKGSVHPVYPSHTSPTCSPSTTQTRNRISPYFHRAVVSV